MSVHLLSLRNVPEEEAAEIRRLLNEHQVDYYETPPGNWLISAGAIWVADKHQLDRAKSIVETYQRDYAQRARENHERLARQGLVDTLTTKMKRHPLQVLLYLAAILLVLYLSTVPFLRMAA